MSDDIVARLRAVLHEDRSVELMNREAADEIERLRNERNAFEAERDELISISNKLKRARDEARWMYCEAVILHGTAHRFGADGTPEPITDPTELAQTLGWDGLEGKR